MPKKGDYSRIVLKFKPQSRHLRYCVRGSSGASMGSELEIGTRSEPHSGHFGRRNICGSVFDGKNMLFLSSQGKPFPLFLGFWLKIRAIPFVILQ
jgi:hypothetical protein